MAKNKCIVYLGYEDENVSDKNRSLVNFTTNKIGGQPDWPLSDISIPPCTICGLKRLLIAQIYAPLDNSQFNRTLYVFTCLSPLCSTQSQSWVCIRAQIIEKIEKESMTKSPIATNLAWCNDEDDWGDQENQMSISDSENFNEENGNTIKTDNRHSDEDESTSMDNDPIPLFGNLNVDDKNANCGAQAGAVGRIHSPHASAEIEGEESELVSIETPIEPQRDIIALLKQTHAIPSNLENIFIKSFFVAVDEEPSQMSQYISEHIRDLMQEYQLKDENLRISPDSPIGACAIGSGANIVGDGVDQEQYEKGTPAHGDVIFYEFLTRIQQNPGQILRYSRDTNPLLIRSLTDPIPKCAYCGSETICELQILPTLIPRLRLDNGDAAPIEFGNVLIFSCLKSCWDTPDRYRYENVIVQEEI